MIVTYVFRAPTVRSPGSSPEVLMSLLDFRALRVFCRLGLDG